MSKLNEPWKYVNKKYLHSNEETEKESCLCLYGVIYCTLKMDKHL